MFVRRDDYLAAGGFDEDLAVAYNDVDFCLRMPRRGLKVVCDPEIKLIHKESKSRGHDNTPAKAARLAREARLMRDRWAGDLADPFYNPSFKRANTRFEPDDKDIVQLPCKSRPGQAPAPAAPPAVDEAA